MPGCAMIHPVLTFLFTAIGTYSFLTSIIFGRGRLVLNFFFFHI
jgi:hypothetical protein